MTADLLVIVPSRGRPKNVAALIEAWGNTWKDGPTSRTHLLIAIDADDPELAGYRDLNLPDWASRTTMPQRLRLGGTLNTLAYFNAPYYRAIGFLGDDHRPRTQAWNQHLMAALDDMGTGMVYGNDLFQGPNLPTAIAMTSDIVRSLGYMVPGGLVHLYVDNAWAELGNAIGRLRYLPDVVIEHLHPSAGKAEMDDSYRETNSTEQYSADQHRFEDWKRFSLDSDVARLKELIGRDA